MNVLFSYICYLIVLDWKKSPGEEEKGSMTPIVSIDIGQVGNKNDSGIERIVHICVFNFNLVVYMCTHTYTYVALFVSLPFFSRHFAFFSFYPASIFYPHVHLRSVEVTSTTTAMYTSSKQALEYLPQIEASDFHTSPNKWWSATMANNIRTLVLVLSTI